MFTFNSTLLRIHPRDSPTKSQIRRKEHNKSFMGKTKSTDESNHLALLRIATIACEIFLHFVNNTAVDRRKTLYIECHLVAHWCRIRAFFFDVLLITFKYMNGSTKFVKNFHLLVRKRPPGMLIEDFFFKDGIDALNGNYKIGEKKAANEET